MCDTRITEEVVEKHQQCMDLEIELQKMGKMWVVILPLVLGTLRPVPENNLKTLRIHYKGLIPKLQKSVI